MSELWLFLQSTSQNTACTNCRYCVDFSSAFHLGINSAAFAEKPKEQEPASHNLDATHLSKATDKNFDAIPNGPKLDAVKQKYWLYCSSWVTLKTYAKIAQSS